MCGRFVASTPPAELAARLGATLTGPLAGGDEDPGPRYNVAPSLPVYAVATSPRTRVRQLGLLRWGLVPAWASDPSIGNRMINARAETVAAKPAFREALARRRCIIPADAFYEWARLGPDRKQPFVIRRRDGLPLAFAGLWEVWRPRGEPAAPPLHTCTIITTDANDAVARLHDRMPAVLPPDAWDTWLDPDVHDVAALRSLLVPAAASEFEIYPVAAAVNNARNEGPQLVLPLEGHTPGEG